MALITLNQHVPVQLPSQDTYMFTNMVIDHTNELYNVVVSQGKFHEIFPVGTIPPSQTDYSQLETIDAQGNVALPGFVETHIHLDKALIADRLPNKSGTLQEAIAVTAQLKATFTYEDIYDRAERALRMVIAKGTTHIRTQSEFDPSGGFEGFQAIMALKQKYRNYVDMQVVAFPQEGILKAPGTEQMMVDALEEGADVVGGIPYNDTDVEKHLDIVFGLAKKYGKPIDLHQDFKDSYEDQSIVRVAQRTIDEGFIGRMSVGHLTSLGAMTSEQLKPVIEILAKAQINVMALPMTDLHLGGRKDDGNVRRAVTPIRKLRDGGVNVVLSSNNIRNPFTPYGNGDLVQVAMLAIPVCHLGGADDIHTVLPMITDNAAKACGFEGYGIKVGNPATLVLMDCKLYQNCIIDVPNRILVTKNGRFTVLHGEIFDEHLKD